METLPIKTILIGINYPDQDLFNRVAKDRIEEMILLFATNNMRVFLLQNNIVKIKSLINICNYQEVENGEFDLIIFDICPFQLINDNYNAKNLLLHKVASSEINLIRHLAKKNSEVLLISNPNQYTFVLEKFRNDNINTTQEERTKFAIEAYRYSSEYDASVYNILRDNGETEILNINLSRARKLRYGENPHQKAWYFGELDNTLQQLHGAELSYNILQDIDAGINLATEFEEPAFVIVKHTNPCGVAVRNQAVEAYKAALSNDPVSAYWSIIVTNTEVNLETANLINDLYFAGIVAPDYTEAALLVLAKDKRIVLRQKQKQINYQQIKTLLNGYVVQESDSINETEKDFKVVTKLQPSTEELEDMAFAIKVAKHSKSNAVVLVKNQQVLAISTGQTSNVDALKQAISKADCFGIDLTGACMGADCFFPFADAIEIASHAGIKTIAHTGGSEWDQIAIDLCNRAEIKMAFTGIRHLKH